MQQTDLPGQKRCRLGNNGGAVISTLIEITNAQAIALADLSQRMGPLGIHQLTPETATAEPGDIYVTPRGQAHGYRIAPDGTLTEIGDTLPTPG